MCSPDKGENTPEDVAPEARVMDERNGMKDRRPPRSATANGTTKLIAVALLSMTFGFFLPQILKLNREGGGVEQYIESNQLIVEKHDARLVALEAEAAKGGRNTQADALRAEAKQSLRDAQQDSVSREHEIDCGNKTDTAIAIAQKNSKIAEANSKKLDELKTAIIRLEAKMP